MFPLSLKEWRLTENFTGAGRVRQKNAPGESAKDAESLAGGEADARCKPGLGGLQPF